MLAISCALCCAGCADDASEEIGGGGDAGLGDAGPDVAGSDTGPGDTGADTGLGDTGDTGGGDTGAGDTGPGDTGAGDTGGGDTGGGDTGPSDTGTGDTGLDAGPKDTGVAADGGTWSSTAHVHIHISNTCGVTTDPVSFDVPVGKTVKVSWHNHSVDYRADVWASYGGGYLALEKGATWAETYEHCFIKSTHTEWVDVTPEGSPSACGKQRVYFYCHG